MISPNSVMRRIFYLGPHPDDIVFSCAGSVLADVQSGADVTMVSVFVSGEQADLRRAEDERAARALGCKYLSLDLFEAPDRPELHGSLGLFMPYGPAHLGITSEVVERLRWHISPPALVIAPLGVGGHIDHRIVHEAARSLCFLQELSLAYFEDLPYSLAGYALARRLAALETPLPKLPGTGRASPSVEIAAYRDYLRRLPLMRSWPPGLRALGCHLAARTVYAADSQGQRPGPRPVLRPQLHTVNLTSPARLMALRAYESQWPQFGDSPEALLARFADYGRSLGEPLPADQTYERRFYDDSVGPAKDQSAKP